jgi:hypothetical protein
VKAAVAVVEGKGVPGDGESEGSRKMQKVLEKEGWKVKHKRMERLMKAAGLRSRLSVKY